MISLDNGSLRATITLGMEGAGARIKRERERRDWSQAELARRAGIHRVTLADLERGASQPSLDTLLALAEALRVPLTRLLPKGGR